MLVKESGQRVTMPEIMAHPWFQRSMPAGLLDINSRVDPSKARQVGGRACGWAAARGAARPACGARAGARLQGFGGFGWVSPGPLPLCLPPHIDSIHPTHPPFP